MKTGSNPALWAAHARQRDSEFHAWVEILPNPGPALPGPLHGLPYGAKDIFETRGILTQYGSPLFAGRIGTRDAHLIVRLRDFGAVLIGKTHTTAFASFDFAPTLNLRLPGHTPGGSSSGSAAAVAAGMVPFTIGTQTLGSILRPASFCGVCGFKPTYNLIPFDGALPFAPSLDTVGFFTPTADDMLDLWLNTFGSRTPPQPATRLAHFRLPADPPMLLAIDAALSRLRAAGLTVDTLDPPDFWPGLTAAAFLLNRYEGSRTHRDLHAEHGDRLGRKLSALIREGLTLSESGRDAALTLITQARAALAPIFDRYPVILTPAAAGPPPAGLASTGDPAPNAPWTALGVPAVSIPLPAELPLGLQLTAARHHDDLLLSTAAHIARTLSS